MYLHIQVLYSVAVKNETYHGYLSISWHKDIKFCPIFYINALHCTFHLFPDRLIQGYSFKVNFLLFDIRVIFKAMLCKNDPYVKVQKVHFGTIPLICGSMIRHLYVRKIDPSKEAHLNI